MKSKMTVGLIEELRSNLNQIRQASLQATRAGDIMQVARLTSKAARINKSIMEARIRLDSEF